MLEGFDVLDGTLSGKKHSPTFVQADEWATITPSSGTAPSKRAYSAGAWDETNGRMWIFGGYYGLLLSVVGHGALGGNMSRLVSELISRNEVAPSTMIYTTMTWRLLVRFG